MNYQFHTKNTPEYKALCLILYVLTQDIQYYQEGTHNRGFEVENRSKKKGKRNEEDL